MEPLPGAKSSAASGEKSERFEYELTSLGTELLIRMPPIWTWVVENAEDFRKARRTFDSQDQKEMHGKLDKPVLTTVGAAK